MYIINNSVKNIFRNKGRNILIAIIIFAIIATTVVALIINNTASGIIDDYRNRFFSEVTISPNFEKLIQQRTSGSRGGGGMVTSGINFNQITPEQYVAFGESDLLEKSTYTANLNAVSDTLEALDEDAEMGRGGVTYNISGSTADGEDAPAIVMPTLRVIGNSDLETMTEFMEGERYIEEGRIYEKPGECVVSYEFAELNGIKIDDVIEVQPSFPGEDAETLYLTVVGIYTDLTDETGGMPFRNAMMNRRNEILTSFETLVSDENKDNVSGEGISVDAKYYLKSPDLLEDYKAELAAKGLDMDDFIVSTDEDSYNRVVKPVEGLKGVTTAFLLIVLILGAVILILLSTIAIRERKYEIGVLRAMGMKKGKVAFGLLAETVIITLLCLTLGLGVGAAASQPVSDMLLEQQVEAAESQNNAPGSFGGRAISGTATFFAARPIGGGGIGGGADVEALKEMEVGIGMKTIIEIVIISLLLAVTASIVGIVNVTRYEPMRILTERN